MRSQQHGFTMIELIVVIVILGILAAVALPRFTNMQSDARVAKLNAARGAVQAASSMVHGVALVRAGTGSTTCADGSTADNTTAVCTESGAVAVVNGYPAATVQGIVNAAGLTSTFFGGTVDEAGANTVLANEGYSVAVAGSVVTFNVVGGSGNCNFTYTAAAANGAPVISAVDRSGC